MFERFTKDARAVVVGAVEHAERTGAGSVDAEHLLLALLDRESGRASFVLAALGLTERSDAVREALGEARRRAGLSQADAEALAGLGIDVSGIVARVEEVHGVGAMSGGRKGKGSWSGRRPFGREAKQILEKALRVAVARRDRHIGDEHILLALTVRPGVPGEVLADHGVTHESVVRVLYGGGEAKAG
ncbi:MULTISPECIES: Clp protease N-terminal domain-containing protein [unclassified Streptomyces]|uniref:Clp protease N-terminal domain-containing protein n=1 Tax=unclassified Streptomyces TaxID=2593676 RepID=UPI0024764FCA|nr:MULTISPECIES: Clp protease N-terminal domain-containing protein [unclassified Streptomyces]MDH6452836.1 ATP-dependent Clp protease ATP-binding subunit ClpA [Streptomyces sp. SAI-119]MDH6496605.1 ATP-dependent Clp protease ATP-binding subunit ClpA [Streptomyces sp. SAI-149]